MILKEYVSKTDKNIYVNLQEASKGEVLYAKIPFDESGECKHKLFVRNGELRNCATCGKVLTDIYS
jgi:ribosomal protein S1